MKKTTLCAFLLLSLAMLATAPACWAERPVLGLGIVGGAAVTDAPGDFYSPKAQAVGALGALLEIPVRGHVPLAIALRVHGTTASSLSGGWGYRSHWGGDLRLSGGYRWAPFGQPDSLQLALGVSAGASVNFDIYTWTTLYFFYPGVFLEPHLLLHAPAMKRHGIALVLPIDCYFRRDLDFYGSIGLGVFWRYTLQ
ncbi:MAG: hypothetical protein JXB06_03740 [Spirochaetales bacterium]|nr:hypothetical protein [Spirochaetales bacterium]